MIDCFVRYPHLSFTYRSLASLVNVFAYCVHLQLGEEKLGVIKDGSLACQVAVSVVEIAIGHYVDIASVIERSAKGVSPKTGGTALKEERIAEQGERVQRGQDRAGMMYFRISFMN